MEIELKKLGEITTGNTPSKKDGSYWDSEDICFVKPDRIADEGITLINDSSEYISENARSKARVVSKDAVFVTCIGSIGKIGIASSGDYAFNQQINAIEPNEKVLPRYLAYNLLYSKPRLEAIANAPVVPIINKTQFGDFKLNIEEDIAKQAEIVSVLDKLTGIIESRKKELESFDELIKARFVEMFGDLADPACEWEKCKLVDVCVNSDDIKCGPFGTQLGKDEYTEKGVAVWEIPQINSEFRTLPTHFVTEKKAEELDAYSIIPGDIAMSRKGNVGRCAVFPSSFENGIIHSDVLRIRLNEMKALPEFMMRQLRYSGDIQHQIELVSSGAIMAGINVTKLKQILIYLPPMNSQSEFVEFVAQVDKSKVAVQKSLDETQLLFNSLMQKYFG